MRHSMQSLGYLTPVERCVWFLVALRYYCQAFSLQVQGRVSSTVLSPSVVIGLLVARWWSIDWCPGMSSVWTRLNLLRTSPLRLLPSRRRLELIWYAGIVCHSSLKNSLLSLVQAKSGRATYSCSKHPLSTSPVYVFLTGLFSSSNGMSEWRDISLAVCCQDTACL